jgi:hypothetical protein
MSGNIVSAVSQFLDARPRRQDCVGLGHLRSHGGTEGARRGRTCNLLQPRSSCLEAWRGTTAGRRRRQATPGALENLANTVGGSGHGRDRGGDRCPSLLGGSSFGSLANVIGKFTGLGEGAIAPSSACSLRSSWACSDAKPARARWTEQIAPSQKDNFAAAMPAGLSNLLQPGGLQDGNGVRLHRQRAVRRQPIAALARAPAEWSTP